MDVTDENMTLKEMLEKISELNHSQSQLKHRNAEMRHLLDVADDEMTVLRSDNEAYRRQVKAFEQIVVDGQHVEAQPCRLPPGDELDVKQSTEIKLQELEMECNAMKEQNKNLIAEVQRLQHQSKQDKMSLSKFSLALKNFEFRTEEAQIEQQQRDEVIQQNKLQLKQAEETAEEYSNIIKDLRLANRELRCHLEDREEEALLAALSHLKSSHIPGMSLAEEIKVLATPFKTSIDSRQEETDSEEANRPAVKQQTNKCAQAKELFTQKVFVFCMAIITILVILAAGSHARYLDFLPVLDLWRSVHLTLQPYFSVHHGALPPI
ncbi:uncharacterized protein LOC144058856 isoform X2 [Vanacampus margaritifer]